MSDAIKAALVAERQAMRWETDQGPVSMTFPAVMTLQEIDDLQTVLIAQLHVLRRRARRALEASDVARAAQEARDDR